MAHMAGEHFIARVRRTRGIDNLQHGWVPNIADMSEIISNFLQGCETTNSAEYTHAVLDSYQEWWLNQRLTFKLAIAEHNMLEILYEYSGTLRCTISASP